MKGGYTTTTTRVLRLLQCGIIIITTYGQKTDRKTEEIKGNIDDNKFKMALLLHHHHRNNNITNMYML